MGGIFSNLIRYFRGTRKRTRNTSSTRRTSRNTSRNMSMIRTRNTSRNMSMRRTRNQEISKKELKEWEEKLMKKYHIQKNEIADMQHEMNLNEPKNKTLHPSYIKIVKKMENNGEISKLINKLLEQKKTRKLPQENINAILEKIE